MGVPARLEHRPLTVYCTETPYSTLRDSLHCTALHCTALQCTALHCSALYCIALHYTALHCTEFYPVPPGPRLGHLFVPSVHGVTKSPQLFTSTLLHCTSLGSTILFYIQLFLTALHCTALHWSVLICTAFHCTGWGVKNQPLTDMRNVTTIGTSSRVIFSRLG